MSPSHEVLVDLIHDRATTAPFLVGVAGPVAVGKTTIVRAIAAGLESRGRRVGLLTTDAFLLPNDVLNERGLLMRKGFPETYDWEAIGQVLGRLRSGEEVAVNIYSHDSYDILPGRRETIVPDDFILLEGVVALQPLVSCHLDLALYVDAPEGCVRDWFVERFVRLTEEARGDASSFYRRFARMSREQVRQLAAATWDAINGPNLREHIAPTAASADIVVVKAANHSIAELRVVPPQ